jgi:uncharacterized protein YbjT (DUF2867 family)
MTSRTAVVLGASGLVGGFCLKALVDDTDYTRVLTFGRRELPPLTRAKVTQRVADLGSLSAEDFRGAQDVFSALGTTIRKAGSQSAFRKVDLELPLRAAQEALQAGAEQFVVVSSVGADPNSLRPSLLTGKRPEFRLGESIAITAAPLLDLLTLGQLRRYHSIKAEIVGRAMVGAAKSGRQGTFIHEFDAIRGLTNFPDLK